MHYTENDIAFIRAAGDRPLPDSFLAEMRARRLGIDRSQFAMMRKFDQAREIADEAAIIQLPGSERLKPFRPDDVLLDAIAKRERIERAQAFQEYLAKVKA